MVDKDGNAVLLDFGTSRLRFEKTRTLTNMQTFGTLRFLAPELSTGEGNYRTTERSDVYSFGMLIYQLLYDIIPFDNLLNEFAVLRSVMAGHIPHRPELPDDRVMLPAWQVIEEKLWPMLQATWTEQMQRIGLNAVHKIVRSLRLY